MGLGVRAGVVSVIPLDCKPDRLLTAIAGVPNGRRIDWTVSSSLAESTTSTCGSPFLDRR